MSKNDKLYEEYFANRNAKPPIDSDAILPSYLTNVLPADKKARILDIGCGWGTTLQAFKKIGFENLQGIDISASAIAHCKSQGLNVERIHTIISYCKKHRRKYDFILMSHVLEHIEKSEIIETLNVLRSRALEKEGCLCIMVPNAQSNTGCYWAYEDFTHSVLFTAGSLYFVLKSAGFTNVEFLDINGLEGSGIFRKSIKTILQKVYKININFWNKVTVSSFHRPSPQIYTFEIKAIAKY